jgi:RNA ligase (TIGR02306 family)
MVNNSVCYVGKIKSIEPIQGADNIELITIDGWTSVVKKGIYSNKDLVIIATVDAVIPKDLSEKLNVTAYLRSGTRVRTVKLKGVYSEALIIPIDFIDEQYRKVKQDCQTILGIYKYEPPVQNIKLDNGNHGNAVTKKPNLNFPVYYKMSNYKNVPDIFDETDIVEITRKYHGTNARFGIVKKQSLTTLDKIKKFFGNKWIEYEFVFGSHNVEKLPNSKGFYTDNVWYTVLKKYNIDARIWKLLKSISNTPYISKNFVIFGEILGPGIQKNYDYGLKNLHFKAFDVLIDGKYIGASAAQHIIYQLGLEYVDVLYEGKWSKHIQDQFVFENYVEGTKVPHEGIVVKSYNGSRQKIAKIINPSYLIYSETHNVGDSH